MKFKLSLLVLLLSCTAAAAQTYSNPVIRQNCPDPTVLDDRARSGWFYAYSTQTSFGSPMLKDSSAAESDASMVYLPIYRSRNLVDWEFVCDGFPQGKPAWVKDSKLWAPDINYIDGKYVLYYALGVWGGIFAEGSGVAVSDSPTGPFTDLGKVVDFRSTGTLNSIDPDFFIDDDGSRYLLWGSLGGGIVIMKLSPDGMSTAKGARKKHIAARNMEGASLFKRDGWYYLVASQGTCCEGEKSSYHLVLGRSRSIYGPYRGPDGKKMIKLSYDNTILKASADSLFVGPGHCSGLIRDNAGQDWILYHSYWKGNGFKGRCLCLDRLVWDGGWPSVAGIVPSISAETPHLD